MVVVGFDSSTAQDEPDARRTLRQYTVHLAIMRFMLTAFSVKWCFYVMVSMQLWFLLTFGPRFYGERLHQFNIRLNDNESTSGIQRHTTSSPSYTTTNTSQTTRPMIDIDRAASLFIHEYETKCIEKRNATSGEFKLCPCLPPELSEYNFCR